MKQLPSKIFKASIRIGEVENEYICFILADLKLKCYIKSCVTESYFIEIS